jgi:hypothetical protein
MKVLAEYVMAGPKQASIFCLGFGLLPLIGPWLSCAGLALVVLQLGLKPASKVLPWAVLPSLVWLALGDPSSLMLLVTVLIAAITLQASRSLGLAILSAVSASAVGFLLITSLMPQHFDQLNKVMNEVLNSSPEMEKIFPKQGESSEHEHENGAEGVNLEQTEQESNSAKAISKADLQKTIEMLTKMAFAWAAGMTACFVLLIGRWWQSLLYKPGAFQTEFHNLRLTRNQVLVVFVIIVVLMQGLQSLSDDNLGMVIAPLFTIPLLLSGIALVHGLVAIAGVSAHWLGFFYMALIFIGHLVYLPLIVTAMIDVVIDFRSRFRRSKSSK